MRCKCHDNNLYAKLTVSELKRRFHLQFSIKQIARHAAAGKIHAERANMPRARWFIYACPTTARFYDRDNG